jgi:GT2 family glycosyltransferase
VCAVILTYSSPESLDECLAAVRTQTAVPGRVLVVDNGSPVPARVPPGVDLLTLPSNGGPGGGWHEALRHFLVGEEDFVWALDDDCHPRPACLATLLQSHAAGLTFPTWIQPDGSARAYPAWCGWLGDRESVERLGLPRAELVWWCEDTEYLDARARRRGVAVARAPEAVVDHRPRRRAAARPAWKAYYETRNTIWFRTRVRSFTARNVRRLLVAVVALGRDAAREGHLSSWARGVLDGVAGRLGQRVPLDSTTARAGEPAASQPDRETSSASAPGRTP